METEVGAEAVETTSSAEEVATHTDEAELEGSDAQIMAEVADGAGERTRMSPRGGGVNRRFKTFTRWA